MLTKLIPWAVLLCSSVSTPEVTSASARTLLDRLALFPSTQPITDGSHERRVLPGGLEVWIHRRPATAAPTRRVHIVHFIGNASRAEKEAPGKNLLQYFPADLDVEVWSLNYPGYGGSAGQATFMSFANAALGVYDALAAAAASTSPEPLIVISGTSIGSLPALYVATQRPAAALVLRNPVPLRELILEKYRWVARALIKDIPPEMDSIHNASSTRMPALVLTSELDTVVEPFLQQKILAAYRGTCQQVIMPQIDHHALIPAESAGAIQTALTRLLR